MLINAIKVCYMGLCKNKFWWFLHGRISNLICLLNSFQKIITIQGHEIRNFYGLSFDDHSLINLVFFLCCETWETISHELDRNWAIYQALVKVDIYIYIYIYIVRTFIVKFYGIYLPSCDMTNCLEGGVFDLKNLINMSCWH